MALNWAMLSPEHFPVPLPNELTIEIVSNAEVTLVIPDAPPALGTPTEGSGGSRRLKGIGSIHLTDQRLIFVASKTDDDFKTLSMPLPSILSSKFEQPFFGSNFIAIEIKPSKDGGLTPGSRAEIRLKDQGMFKFASALDKTRERAIYMKRQTDMEADTLPLYEGVDESEAGSSSIPPPPPPPGPDELPPGYDA